MDIRTILGSYLLQSPILLVWLVGITLAVVYWRRHPRISLLTVIALAVLLLETLVSTFLNMWMPLMLQERGIDTAQIGLIFAVKGIVFSIIITIAWGMLLFVIFSGRKNAAVGDKQSLDQGSHKNNSQVSPELQSDNQHQANNEKILGTFISVGGVIFAIQFNFTGIGLGGIIGTFINVFIGGLLGGLVGLVFNALRPKRS